MERSAEWPGRSVSMKAETARRGAALTPRLGSFSKGAGQQEAHRCGSGSGRAPGTHQGSVGPRTLESGKKMQLFVFLDELDKQGRFWSSSHESRMGDVLPGPLGMRPCGSWPWTEGGDLFLGWGAGLAGALRDPTNQCPSWGCGVLGFRSWHRVKMGETRLRPLAEAQLLGSLLGPPLSCRPKSKLTTPPHPHPFICLSSFSGKIVDLEFLTWVCVCHGGSGF